MDTKGSAAASEPHHCGAVFSLWYITVLPKTTQPQNLWSHLVQEPPTAGPPGGGCSEPYPAIFKDEDDIPLRMRRCVSTWRQAGHTFWEGTYNYIYFQYQIFDNKKGAYSLPSTFTLQKTPETAFQWWRKQQSLIGLKMEIASFLWKCCDAVVCASRESLSETKHFGKYCPNWLGLFCCRRYAKM